MSLAAELRDVIEEWYLPGTPEGKRLEEIAVKIEALEANPHLEEDGSTSWDEE